MIRATLATLAALLAVVALAGCGDRDEPEAAQVEQGARIEQSVTDAQQLLDELDREFAADEG